MTDDRAPALFTAASLPEQYGGGRSVSDRVASSVPPNTRRAYERIGLEWRAWCDQQGRQALPASGETLAEFVNYLLNRGRLDRAGRPLEPWQPLSRSTVDQAMAAVRTLHRLAGHPGEPNTERARQTVRGWAREQAEQGAAEDEDQAAPLLLADIRAIIDHTDLTTHKGARDRALLVIGFAGMLRRSELAGLRIGDVDRTDDGLDVRLATSKTDKDARGVRVPIPRGQHAETCPVRSFDALRARLELRGVDAPAEPLFRAVTRHGDARGQLRPADVTLVVREAVRRAVAGGALTADPDDYWGTRCAPAAPPPPTPPAPRSRRSASRAAGRPGRRRCSPTSGPSTGGATTPCSASGYEASMSMIFRG